MANIFTTQVLKDTEKSAVIKFTAIFDGSGQESANVKINGAALKGALDTNGNLYSVTASSGGVKRSSYNYTVYRMVYDIKIPSGYVLVNFDGATPGTAAILGGAGDTNGDGRVPALTNTATTPNGNLTFTTAGAVANCAYTVILEIHKDNNDYSAGQHIRPNDFNYFGVKP